jgi:hypothetical protein
LAERPERPIVRLVTSIGVGPSARRGHAVADLDTAPDVEDLDDGGQDAGPPPPRGGGWTHWPARLPPWASGPGALLALVVAVALVATLVTGAQVRTVERQRREAQAALLSLQVGSIGVASQNAPATSGFTQVGVTVLLANRGPRVLTVAVLGLTAAHQHTVRPPAEVNIHPGTTSSVPFLSAVDCARVTRPRPGSSSATPPAAVAARLTLPEGASPGGAAQRTVRLPLFPDASQALTAQLFSLCHPLPSSDLSTTWAYPADGDVVVTVTSSRPAGSPPVTLALQQSPGVGAVSRPGLPLQLSAGRTVRLELSAHPDCTVVGDGSTSRLDVVTVDDARQTTTNLDPGSSDPAQGLRTGTVAWLARLIALQCP